MKRLLLILTLLFAMTAGAVHAKDTGKEGLLVNLTTNDCMTAMMAVSFASKSLEQGHPTTILLNVTGAHLAEIKAPTLVHPLTGETMREKLEKFMKKGGKVMVCGMLMKTYGMKQSDLISGIEIGVADTVFPAIFKKSSRVISY